MTIEISGEYNTAIVHTEQSRADAEDEAVEQIEEMVNHEAFVGDDDVAIMPDAHWGAGAVIGFTMSLTDRVVPNTIGVDIGCGMYALCLGEINIDPDDYAEIDDEIRDRVPTGFDVHDRNDYHMINDFPWEVCEAKRRAFVNNTDIHVEADYLDEDFFTDLCQRVGYDMTRAINSMGTLGGGNHFIELGRDAQDRVWTVIHSGSRGIGATIAEHWQDKATSRTTMRQTIEDVPEDVRAYMTDDWKPKADEIRADFEGESIQRMFDRISQAIQEYGPSTADRNMDLDYLDGDEASGYIRDMIFAQTYASESRNEMAWSVFDAIHEVVDEEIPSFEDMTAIESVHNYIDFYDGTIRKGACRAHEGEQFIVPMNMSYGTLICRGKGQADWNRSGPHGAGRAMSRTGAKERYSESDYDEQASGVYMSEQPVDEIPGAYKDPEMVRAAIGDNAVVEDRIVPFLSVKAGD